MKHRIHDITKCLTACVGCALLLTSIAGCGGDSKPPVPLAKTTGTVTYNGDPVEGATVTMITKGGKHTATAQTDANGKFEMFTIVGGKKWPGMPLGEVMIGVAKYDDIGSSESTPEDMMKMGSETLISKSQLPAKYESPLNSGLNMTVSQDESQNDFTIELVDQ